MSFIHNFTSQRRPENKKLSVKLRPIEVVLTDEILQNIS